MSQRDSSKAQHEVIWPVDAFQCDQRMLERVGVALTRFFGARVPVVQPVFILTPNATPLPLGWFDEALPRLRKDATERLEQVLAKCPFAIGDPKILVEHSGHSENVVEKLNLFADRSKARLIVVPTRAKTGLSRLMLGSFAESMLLFAKTPLLTVNDKLQQHSRKRRVCLLPVDFSTNDSPRVFDRVLETLGQGDLEIILFHAMPPRLKNRNWPDKPLFIHSKELIVSSLSEEQERCRKLGDKLVTHAERAGLRAKNVLGLSLQSVPEAIVGAADKEAANFIAIVSKATRYSFIFAGSVTRKVVRMAPCPVWALSDVMMKKR